MRLLRRKHLYLRDRLTAKLQMTIKDIVESRGIETIVHFTTNRGSLGVLASKALKARARLDQDARLEKIFYPNAASRPRDAAWLDYVNLSVTQINTRFFGVASGSWHKEQDFWWCILAFDPVILEHDGVVFTTTNNMYSGVARASGEAGLASLFEPSIRQWHSSVVTRSSTQPANLPTCPQAEVLYPGELATTYLQKIYVSNATCGDELAGQMAAVAHPPVPIEIRPDLFSDIK